MPLLYFWQQNQIMINTYTVFCFEVWLEQNSHCHIYHRENLVFTGTIGMLDTEGFLNIFSNTFFSPAGIAGHLQARMQQIILPEQREFACQKAFPSTVIKTPGHIFSISAQSTLCLEFFLRFVLNHKITTQKESVTHCVFDLWQRS